MVWAIGTDKNGMGKMVQTKWNEQNGMGQIKWYWTKWYWTKWYGQNGTD